MCKPGFPDREVTQSEWDGSLSVLMSSENPTLATTWFSYLGRVRTCTECLLSLPLEEFQLRNKKTGTRRQKCKTCTKNYLKQWRVKNHEHFRKTANDYQREDKRKRRDWVRQAKEKPCTDCGVEYPYYVMQFDHVNPADKSFAIGPQATKESKKRLRAEIEKCDVVCANCHSIRTWKRKHDLTAV